MKTATLKSVTLLTSLTAAIGLAACGGGSSSGGGDDDGVAAAAGCYFVPEADISFAGAGISFEWPGGAGPNPVAFFSDPSCEDIAGGGISLVVASDAAAAADLCPEVRPNATTVNTNPGVANGSFFVCNIN